MYGGRASLILLAKFDFYLKHTVRNGVMAIVIQLLFKNNIENIGEW